MASARFRVSGKVQGVFYRASTREQALALGLTGYARNLPDGAVEVLACGDARAIEALERWLWQGPRRRGSLASSGASGTARYRWISARVSPIRVHQETFPRAPAPQSALDRHDP
jgi:acylphosphatase